MATTDINTERQLLQQAEKILLHPIHPHLISYCPTMDLIAVVTDEENLDVYRINGQRAFGLKRKSEDVAVNAIMWEFNGKSIAVSWSDGSTDLVSAETGKVTHKDVMLPSSEEGDEESKTVKCMGWGLNFIDVEAVKARTGMSTKKTNGEVDGFGNPTTEDWDAFKDDTTLDDFLQRQPDFQTLDIAPDLPDQLAMMDMEALLPKLPGIPLPPALPFMRVSQADSGAFSSQVEVDSLLHSHHLKDHNSVDMFIRLSDHGTVHPSIYDSLETVSVQLPKAWNISSTPLLHTSHPYSCTHSLLMRTTTPIGQNATSLIPLTLNFIPSAGIYLHLIAAKTSQLQNLLLYITQTLQRIRAFFKHAHDLPRKFMLNISETLEEKGMGDLVTNLFHIACTGNCHPIVKEWLVDELAEQGHKRWDTTVTTSYTTLLALLHENLIPALDRCSIVISRLRGLAKFHDRDWIFSGPVSDFDDLLETLKCMRLLAHTAMLYATEKKRMFHAFSKWLRFTIDFEATEPDSQSRAEMEIRDPGVDISHVLAYIQYGLTKSDLTPYLGPMAKPGARASYEDTKKAIELLKEGATFMGDALCLEQVLGHLGTGVTGLLKQVSAWQENNIQMDSGIVLEDTDEETMQTVDMRMVVESNETSTYILLSPNPSSSTLHIHRLTHTQSITSLPKDIHSYAITTLDFSHTGNSTTILDAKFADDKTLLLLLQQDQKQQQDTNPGKQQSKTLIISIPYTPPPHPPSHIQTRNHSPLIQYTPLPSEHLPSTLLPRGAAAPTALRQTVAMTPHVIEKHTRHVFEGRFTPLKLIVNGRKGRRVIVVLGSDRKHYRVLDMDYRQRRARAEGEDGTDGSETEEDGGGMGDGDVEMSGA